MYEKRLYQQWEEGWLKARTTRTKMKRVEEEGRDRHLGKVVRVLERAWSGSRPSSSSKEGKRLKETPG